MEPLTTHGLFAVPLRFAAGVVAAVLATLVMDGVMAKLPEGTTPPSVAAGVLTDRPPGEAPDRLAAVVHYLAGSLTGPLFVWLLFVGEGVSGGASTVATFATAVVLYVLMVGFFTGVVLPRSRVSADRVGTIRRDWAVAAAAYLIVLIPLVAGAFRLL
jgi:hypothetical protein